MANVILHQYYHLHSANATLHLVCTQKYGKESYLTVGTFVGFSWPQDTHNRKKERKRGSWEGWGWGRVGV